MTRADHTSGDIDEVVIVTPHDLSRPSAVGSRYVSLAKGLDRWGVRTRFVVAAAADAEALRPLLPEAAWDVLGPRSGGPVGGLIQLRRLPPISSRRPIAVLSTGRVPALLHQGRRAARRADVPALVELTELPDVVLPDRLGRGLYLRVLIREIARMDGVLVISRALEEWVRHHAARTPVFELPMLVDLDRFPGSAPDQSVARRSGHPLVLGYAGSLNPAKDGLDLLIRAVAQLDPWRVRLRIWGHGAEQAQLTDLTRRLEVADRVSFEGTIPWCDVPHALETVDCLVLPRPSSRQATAGFPTKLGEYLATGRPVIATLTGDIGTKLSRSEALLIPPDDVRRLAEAIRWVAEHPEEAATVGVAGRAAAQREFAADVAARRLLDAVATVGQSAAHSIGTGPT